MMDFAGLCAEVRDSLLRRGFLSGYSPTEDVDPMVLEQALRWSGEVGEFCQRLAKDGGKDRRLLAAEWADAMIVGYAVAALLNLGEDEIVEKMRADELRGRRHGAIGTIMEVARKEGRYEAEADSHL